MLDEILKDARHGLRVLLKSPGFTAVALLAIGLGVGANTAIFSIMNGLFLRPLPVAEPGRLVWVTTVSPDRARPMNLSYPDYLDYRERSRSFDGLAGFNQVSLSLSGRGGEPERIAGETVTSDYFQVLGVRPAAGRAFAPDDGRPGAEPSAILGHSLWARRYGSDPSIVGASITINGHPFTVIGVAPDRFVGIELGPPTQIWITLSSMDRTMPHFRGLLDQRDSSWLRVVGRLGRDVSLAGARAEMLVLSRQIEHEHAGSRVGLTARLSRLTGSLHPMNTGEAVPLLALLMGVTGLVLLIACANVANLLLGRAASRRREIGVRLALGATRGRLVRQLLTESVLLSAMGGVAGTLMGIWGIDLLLALGQAPAEIADASVVDWRVLVFAMAAALAAGVAAGLVPAMSASRPDLVPALKGEAAAGPRGGRPRAQRALVITQVSISLVLLVSAGLFLRSLRKAAGVDAGFETRSGLTLSFDLPLQGYSPERRTGFCRQLLERVEALPGVRSASLTNLMPLSGKMMASGISLEGGETDDERFQPTAFMSAVWPGFLRTLEIPLRSGREFDLGDRGGAPGVVIVNETAAERFWPQHDPLGRRLSLEGAAGPFLEVIGVARDIKYDDLTEDPRPFIYLPYQQHPDLLPELALVVRTRTDPAPLIQAVRDEVRALDPDLPIYNAATLTAHVALRNDKPRFMAALLAAFGGLALLLATMGLYGVMAYVVAQRTREIGIRMALGARRGDVLGQFVREGVRLALIGVGAGLLLAAGFTRLISSMLFGVTATDLATFVGVSFLLAAVAAAASYVPARRAANLDPMAALRCE